MEWYGEDLDIRPVKHKYLPQYVESDDIERKLIKSVFDSPADKAEMILLKGLIRQIGSIADRAENAADRLTIIAIKRQT